MCETERARQRRIRYIPQTTNIDVQGVGYDVHVPLSTYYEIGDPGADIALRVYTHVREDALQLFGFASRFELDLFTRLIGISGIGPKLALAVLSGIEPAELVRAVRAQNIARLTSIPGIGKKTAERLLLELKGKIGADLGAVAGPVDDAQGDILQALVALGYSDKEAALALKALPPDVGVSDGIKLALRSLAR